MRIELAGMSREVCASCGRVSVGYVEEHFSPEGARAIEEHYGPEVPETAGAAAD